MAAISCKYCCCGKAMSNTQPESVCVCSLKYPARNAHASYCHLRPAPLYSVFLHYLINGTFSEIKSLNTKYVFWFSVQFWSLIFLILRNNKRNMITIYIWLHVKYPTSLSDFNEAWIFFSGFPEKKIFKYKLSRKIGPVEAELFHVDGQTWRS
jgi:hypothetical protein